MKARIVARDFPRAADVGRDHPTAHRQRFKLRQTESLVRAGRHEDVCRRKEVCDIGSRPCPAHMCFHTQAGCGVAGFLDAALRFGIAAQRLTDEHETALPARGQFGPQVGEHRREQRQALLWAGIGNGDEHEVVLGEAPSLPPLGAGSDASWGRLELLQVNAIPGRACGDRDLRRAQLGFDGLRTSCQQDDLVSLQLRQAFRPAGLTVVDRQHHRQAGGGNPAHVAAANEMAVNHVGAKRNGHARQRGGARFRIPSRPRQVESAGRCGKCLAHWAAQGGQARAHVAGRQFSHEIERQSFRASTVERGDHLQHAQAAVAIYVQRRIMDHAKLLERYTDDVVPRRNLLIGQRCRGDRVEKQSDRFREAAHRGEVAARPGE